MYYTYTKIAIFDRKLSVNKVLILMRKVASLETACQLPVRGLRHNTSRGILRSYGGGIPRFRTLSHRNSTLLIVPRIFGHRGLLMFVLQRWRPSASRVDSDGVRMDIAHI